MPLFALSEKRWRQWVLGPTVTLPIWVLLGLVLYWQYVDYAWRPPATVGAVLLVTPVVRAGGKVEVKFHYAVHRDGCERRVEVWRRGDVQELVVAHEGATIGEGEGMRTQVRRFAAGTVPGEYQLAFIVKWVCNPLRSWYEVWPLVTYTVIA